MGKQHKVESWGDQKIWHESKSASVDLKNGAELVRVWDFWAVQSADRLTEEAQSLSGSGPVRGSQVKIPHMSVKSMW